MKKLKFYLSVMWRPLLLWLAGFALICGMLFYHLESLTPGVSQPEKSTYLHLETRDLGIREIVQNPEYLPYNVVIYLFEKASISGLFASRAISAAIGVLSVYSFYYLVSRWHTRRMALLATLLFATSSWFLHTVRLATTDSTFMLFLPLLACGAWLHDVRQRGAFPLLGALIFGGMMLYVPGMIWFALAGLIWQRRRLLETIADLKWKEISIASLIVIIMVLPFAFAVAKDLSILATIAGVPDGLRTPSEYAARLINIPKQLFWRGPADATSWVGRMPLLDVFTAVAFGLGIYAYYSKLRLDRTKILVFGLLLGATLYVVGSMPLAFILPLIYIVAAAGITGLMQQWQTVFPRNPLARGIGSTLLTAAVLISCAYNLTHYFIAWPNAPETKQAFTQER
jgi:hypothetical protein